MHVSCRARVKSNVNRFCPLVGLLVVSALGADTPLDSLLKTVEQRYNRAGTLQVLFREEYRRTGHATRAESGTLDLRSPGRMRWDYSDPKGKLGVSDGKVFWLYEPTENTVTKYDLKDFDNVAPIAFLLGKLHFDKEFRNIKGQPEGTDTRISAEPKSDGLPYSGVEFLVTKEGRIREVKVTRMDNSITGYLFDQEKVGPKLDDKLFQFQVPKGAQVVEPVK